MTIINPLLLAGPEQIKEYQKQRIEEWTKKKGESQTDFDHYFADIVNQWDVEDFQETSVDIDEFQTESIDLETSINIQKELKKAGLLNSNGFINLKTISIDSVIDALKNFPGLTDDEKQSIAQIIQNIQYNKPIDFETFSKSMFTYTPNNPNLQQFTINESTSISIWNQLNAANIIDDYGVLLLKPNSSELSSAINGLSGLTESQKERILSILNQHPELSYHSYMESFEETPDSSSLLPRVGIYLPDGVPIKKIKGLTKEQLDYIKIVAVLEWNVMLVSQKSIHNSRKKSIKKVKDEKKKDKQENEQFIAKIEAKYQEDAKKRLEKKKKSGG